MTRISMKLLADNRNDRLYLMAAGDRNGHAFKLFAGFDPEFGSIEVQMTLKEAVRWHEVS